MYPPSRYILPISPIFIKIIQKQKLLNFYLSLLLIEHNSIFFVEYIPCGLYHKSTSIENYFIDLKVKSLISKHFVDNRLPII